MPTIHQPLFPEHFLAAHWAAEYRAFCGSQHESSLLHRLNTWASKKKQKETAAEAAFIGLFFKQTWGYSASGETSSAEYTCEQQFQIKAAGQSGGVGFADLALGIFGRSDIAQTPQAVCEFKGIRASLDSPQQRKGNDRSPVKQCADYLRAAINHVFPNEPIQPTWGIVSDMNEFRLYWRNKMPAQYQRFVIKPSQGDEAFSLLGEDESSTFRRFIFWKMFQKNMLLSTGGPSPLERLLSEQWIEERSIENDFYKEYQSYRSTVYTALVDANPEFKGTRGKLVRLTQRFLDRCIFVLFCEDMGTALQFPPNILRSVLVGISNDPDYDPDDDVAWTRIKKLFTAMRDGSPFREHQINRFNGGLFAVEPELESLHIPTRLFCSMRQGSSPSSIQADKETLLYFSASYNFGVTGADMERSISLYTLGRIFEQSITELEFMEAKAEGRTSVAELSKRKRDGVYYTPDWITSYIVEETVGVCLAEFRRKLALEPAQVFSTDEIDRYQRARSGDQRFKADRVSHYMMNLDQYEADLATIKVLDPACGSGAFLIKALDRLINERRWISVERQRLTGMPSLFDIDTVAKSVLTNNIYGVDINEESVEITRLALWLHTALPDRPLTSLDTHIRCGNSLVDSSFYQNQQKKLFSEAKKEQINAFDWQESFPEVFSRAGTRSGFDCIIGNPPYVKLQHFRRVLPEVAEFLISAKSPDSSVLYESTQTKNFDMYLPFIERGISLLNAQGRMGFIAPSLWLISEYGDGIRRKMKATRRLERWVDFKDYSVFEEVMTYTAVQFYRGHACDSVRYMFVPNGELGALSWDAPDALIMYGDLPDDDVWVMVPQRERVFLDRLNSSCPTLGEVAEGIIVGIQTSADPIYHLERLGENAYRQYPKGLPPVEVQIEDRLMRPLITGSEAKRYQEPDTSTYLLFPYDDSAVPAKLYPRDKMQDLFPNGWRYLVSHESVLRSREGGKMDRDDIWWGYNYPKNIEKQRVAKLGVAQTVPEMRVFFDRDGRFCFNNVRVNGILMGDTNSAYSLMGILNSRVIDFVFRRIAKPKEPRPSGAYFEANKQYIAPLPVPTAFSDRRLAERAQSLESLHTKRRSVILALDARILSDQMIDSPRSPAWLWADIGDEEYWLARCPDGLKGRALKTWAKRKCAELFASHLASINEIITYGAPLAARLVDGEMRFYVSGRCIISGVYVDDNDGAVILAQWRRVARDTFISDSVDAGRVVGWLLDLRSTENMALIKQIRKLNNELSDLEAQIVAAERELDNIVHDLYGLSDDERRLVEDDTRQRWANRIPEVCIHPDRFR